MRIADRIKYYKNKNEKICYHLPPEGLNSENNSEKLVVAAVPPLPPESYHQNKQLELQQNLKQEKRQPEKGATTSDEIGEIADIATEDTEGVGTSNPLVESLPWQTESLCWGVRCQWADIVPDNAGFSCLVCLQAFEQIIALQRCPLERWWMTECDGAVGYVVIAPR